MSQKKELIKPNLNKPVNQNLSEVSEKEFSGLIPSYIGKRLNFTGLLALGLYSFSLLAAGTYYERMNSSKQNNFELKELTLSINKKISNLKNDKINDHNIQAEQKSLLKTVELAIERSLTTNNHLLLDKDYTLKKKNFEIAKLRENIFNLKQFKKSWVKAGNNDFNSASRTLSSISRPTVNTLRYEQKLKVRNFKELQKSEIKNFLAFVDLKNPEHTERLENLKNSQKLELYKLKEEYSLRRYQLGKKNSY